MLCQVLTVAAISYCCFGLQYLKRCFIGLGWISHFFALRRLRVRSEGKEFFSHPLQLSSVDLQVFPVDSLFLRMEQVVDLAPLDCFCYLLTSFWMLCWEFHWTAAKTRSNTWNHLHTTLSQFNLPWKNEGIGHTCLWNYLSVDVPITFEPLQMVGRCV